jgi:voltage-gated potassium channel
LFDSSLNPVNQNRQQLADERYELVETIGHWLDVPMLVLSFAWLALLVWELVWGLPPLLQTVGTAIWIIFILHFCIEFVVAPPKIEYVKSNW